MHTVDMYLRVRLACRHEGLSRREAARRFGIDRRTVSKMLAFSVPAGYRRSRPPARPKLDPFTGIIDRILEEDRLAPRKQRHTTKRIFERLRDEHGFEGGYTIVKAREARERSSCARAPAAAAGNVRAAVSPAGPCPGGLLKRFLGRVPRFWRACAKQWRRS
jgi:transposase